MSRRALPWTLAQLILAGCGARTALFTGADASAVDAVDVVDVATDRLLIVDGARVPICGDGVIDPGMEACDDGAGNGDVSAFTVSQASGRRFAVRPIAARSDLVSFYNYQSASAHTGVEQVGVANHLLMVDSRSGALGLIFVAGRDADLGTPPTQPESAMELRFSGLPVSALLALCDEPDECSLPGGGAVLGRWSFRENTDGLAIRGLSWITPWRVLIEPRWTAGVNAQQWIDGDRGAQSLVLSQPVILEYSPRSPRCRSDCTLRVCGDRRLDGGERCDDGNTRDGDGCSADCQRFE